MELTEKIIIYFLSGCKLRRSLEGQEVPTRGSKVFNTIILIEAGHLCENYKLLNSKKHNKQHLKLQKADAPSFSSKQSSCQTKRNKKATFNWVQAATDVHPALPQQETKSST